MVDNMTKAKAYAGGCHCGNVQLEFSSVISPENTEIRECQCSFCRKHGTQAIADPRGSLLVKITAADNVNRYSFGMSTAKYIICSNCGVYVAAVTNDKDDLRGIAALNVLDDRSSFTATPISADYSDESRFLRQARRRQKWTPARIEFPK